MSENHPSIQLAVNGDDTGSLVKARRHLAESLAWLVVRAHRMDQHHSEESDHSRSTTEPPFRLMNKYHQCLAGKLAKVSREPSVRLFQSVGRS